MTVRSITDGKGDAWQVTYIHPAIVRRRGGSYRLARGWLCFTGPEGQCVRMPRELFAGDWRRVSAHELRYLLAAGLEENADTCA